MSPAACPQNLISVDAGTTSALHIVEPFSTFGDEIAGDTPDEVALNLAAATRISLAWRCKPRWPLPDLRTVFKGRRLTEEAKDALRWVTSVYARLKSKTQQQEAA